MQHVLTQSEERRLELLQGQVVHSDGSGRLGLHTVAFLQKDRQTLAILLQSRVATVTAHRESTYHTALKLPVVFTENKAALRIHTEST